MNNNRWEFCLDDDHARDFIFERRGISNSDDNGSFDCVDGECAGCDKPIPPGTRRMRKSQGDFLFRPWLRYHMCEECYDLARGAPLCIYCHKFLNLEGECTYECNERYRQELYLARHHARTPKRVAYVYRYYARDLETLLYVGKSVSALARASAHKHTSWWDEQGYMTTQRYESEQEALAAEKKAIQTEHPIYNIVRYT